MFVERCETGETYKKLLLEITRELLTNSQVSPERLNVLNKTNKEISTVEFHLSLKPPQATSAVHQLALSFAMKAERVAVGSLNSTYGLALNLVQEFLKLNLQNPAVILNGLLSESNSILKNSCKRVSWNRVRELLKLKVRDRLVQEMILETLSLAGLEGKITTEIVDHQDSSVELVNGFNFQLSPAFQIVRWNRKNVRCILVDGTIESVSELHQVLQYFAESKESGLILAREFHPDVITTLKVNHDRGSLDVIPVRVPVDFAHMNTLNDVAVVSKNDVVSSLKGELISCLDASKCGCVEQVTLGTNSLSLVNTSALNDVNIQVKKLTLQRLEQESEDLQRLLDHRIKSLTASYVLVRVPAKRAELLPQLDTGFRLVRSLLERGEMNLEFFPILGSSVEGKIFSNVLNHVIFQHENVAAATLASLNFGVKLAMMILSSSGLVLNVAE